MASNQVLKKSFVGGFKKDGVLNYVEQLQSEIVGLKNELEAKESEIASSENLANELENKNAEIEALKSEIEALKLSNSKLIAEKEEAVESCKNDYEEKIKLYDGRFAAIEEKFAAIEYGQSKANETEQLLAKAKEKADSITAKANESVKNAIDEILDLYNAFKTASVNYDSSSVALKNRVEALIETLNSIEIETEAE